MPGFFKVCKRCGSVCTKEVNPCPGPIRGTLDLCESTDFRPATVEEVEKIKERKLNFYYKKWPEDIWPSLKI